MTIRIFQNTLMAIIRMYSISEWKEIFTGPMYKLFVSFEVISDVYRSFKRKH